MPSQTRIAVLFLVSALLSVLAGCKYPNTPPVAVTPGGPESRKTEVLQGGAKALQQTTPVNRFDIHLVGFHPMKDDPSVQMEAPLLQSGE